MFKSICALMICITVRYVFQELYLWSDLRLIKPTPVLSKHDLDNVFQYAAMTGWGFLWACLRGRRRWDTDDYYMIQPAARGGTSAQSPYVIHNRHDEWRNEGAKPKSSKSRCLTNAASWNGLVHCYCLQKLFYI